MRKYDRFSKVIHTAVLCSFFLPFFFTGCGNKKQDDGSEIDATENTANLETTTTEDTSSINYTSTIVENQTPKVDSSNKESNLVITDSNSSLNQMKPKYISERICNTFEFLRPLLIPELNTYTGIGVVIDSIPATPFFSAFISLLFLFISLLIKYIEKNARISIVLLESLALIFLIMATPYSFTSHKLWGYAVALVLIAFLIVYDLYIIRINKQVSLSD
jgi:hypothetical protein